jgi:hypothetical protein
VANKLLVNLDETSGKDTFDVAAKLKAFLTNKNVTVQKKGIDSFKTSNYASWVFTTNNGVAVLIEPSDRRHFAVDCDNTYRNDPQYTGPLLKAFEDDRYARAFYDYLVEQDTGGYDFVNKRPQTRLYQSTKEACVPVPARFLAHLVCTTHQAGDEEVKVLSSELFSRYLEFCKESGFKTDTNTTAFGRSTAELKVPTKRSRAGNLRVVNRAVVHDNLNAEGYVTSEDWSVPDVTEPAEQKVTNAPVALVEQEPKRPASCHPADSPDFD